jgi:hypothetical protein
MGNSCDNEKSLAADSNQSKIDMLALFDKASIGNEFANSPPVKSSERENEAKKEQIMRENWCRHKADKDSSPADGIAKRFSKVKDFEEKSLKWQGAVFWIVFVMLSLVAIAIGMTNKLF